MKFLYSAFFFVSAFISLEFSGLHAQTPSYVWAHNATGNTDDYVADLISDDDGNIYMTGNFSSDQFTIGSNIYLNDGLSDFFLVKLDKYGNVLWCRTVCRMQDENGKSLAIDQSGNIYVAGMFWHTYIVFGTDTLVSKGQNDVFVTKYDPNGNVLWARSAGGPQYDNCYDLSVDQNGNAYVIGSTNSTSIIFAGDVMNAYLNYDVFVLKFDSSGNEIWLQSAHGPGNDYGFSVDATVNGFVYVSGTFGSDTLYFENDTLLTTNIPNTNMYLVKLDTTGHFIWGEVTPGIHNVSMCADKKDNTYLTGSFNPDSVSFDSIVLYSNDPGSFSDNYFVARYDSSGNVLWAKQSVGTGDDYGSVITVDSAQNAYVAGNFELNDISVGPFNLSCAGRRDVFTAKYDTLGNEIWVIQGGGEAQEFTTAISSPGGGEVYMAGIYYFDTSRFSQFSLPYVGMQDIYFAKLGYDINVSSPEQNQSSFTVYPNPVVSAANMYYSLGAASTVSVDVCDITGKTVAVIFHAEAQSPGEYRFPVPSLSPGIYLIKLQTDAGTEVRKLIIQ